MTGSVRERRAALESRHPTWRAMTLAQALDDAAQHDPDRPLIITDERTLSYREVREWSARLAAGLVALGVTPGEHVAMVLANFPEMIALQFAIARAGAVAVPINFLLRAEELGYVLRQSDASLLIAMDRFRDLDHVAMLCSMAPGWERGGAGDALPRLREIVVRETGVAPAAGYASSPCDAATLAARSLSEVERLGDDEAARAELARRERAADPAATATIFYTSGTTGSPKGVMLSHDALLRSGYGSAYTRALTQGQRIVFALPLYHVFAYVEGLLAALFVGGGLIPQTAFDPEATLEAIERHRADEALFVPTMTIAVLEVNRAGDHALGSLRAVMSAAAPAPVRLWQTVRDELGVDQVVTAYGMTETSAATTYTQPDGPLEPVASTVGAPKLGGVAGDPQLGGALCEYKTIDPLSGADLEPGAEGELVARGPIVTTGYYRKPEETAGALDEAGWLRSGDLGRVLGDGSLVLTGRSKELYKCGGELVAPKEVEEVLTEHPSVAQAYVVGLPDERMGEVGCAWVVAAGPEPPVPQALIDHCHERLARFKVPRHVLFLGADELPTTATGKVQKFVLIERALQRRGVRA